MEGVTFSKELKCLGIIRKKNELLMVNYEKGCLGALDWIIKIFGGNTKFEHNRKESMKSFMKDKELENVFKHLVVYPKTREKDLCPKMIYALKSLKIIELYINEKKLIFDNEYFSIFEKIIKCDHVKIELYVYITFYLYGIFQTI